MNSSDVTMVQARIPSELLAKWDWVLKMLDITRTQRIQHYIEGDVRDHWTGELEIAFKQIYGNKENNEEGDPLRE